MVAVPGIAPGLRTIVATPLPLVLTGVAGTRLPDVVLNDTGELATGFVPSSTFVVIVEVIADPAAITVREGVMVMIA